MVRFSSDNEEDVKNKGFACNGGDLCVALVWGGVRGCVWPAAVVGCEHSHWRDDERGRRDVAGSGACRTFLPKLNLFGVPWVGLIPALLVPILLLSIFSTLEMLADLYAIGVVGAIAINPDLLHD